MAGNWIQEILTGKAWVEQTALSQLNTAISSASGSSGSALGGLDPQLAAIIGGLSASPSSDSSSSSSSSSGSSAQAPTPTLAQLLVQSAQETGGNLALTGNTPHLINQTFGLAKTRDLQSGDYLVYMGDGGEIHGEKQIGEVGYAGQVHAGATGGHAVAEPGTPTGHTVPTSKDAGDKVLTAAQAVDMPYLWGQDKIDNAIARMNKAGLEVNTFDDMVNAWQGLVARAAKTYTISGGNKKLTPWDALDLYKSENADAIAASQPFTGNKTTTSRSVSELSDGQAWSVIQSTLQRMLGRDPSDEELRNFTYRMGQAAAHNPSITKTISHYKEGELTGTNSHTSGGFTMDDAMQAAYNKAQNNPDYAEYQAATTYFNAALSALGPIGG